MSTDLQIIRGVLIHRNTAVSLDEPVEGAGLSRSDQTFYLGSREVLGEPGQLGYVHVLGQLLVALHGGGVDIQDLNSAIFFGQTNLHLPLPNVKERLRGNVCCYT